MADRSSASDTKLDLISEFREDPSDIASLVGDLYRGEIDRTTTWQGRLDQTTNWDVVVVAAILTWAFSSPDNPHYVLLIGIFAVTAFLLTEAHCFREYDIWRSRVRVLQRTLSVGILTPDPPANEGWQAAMSESLETPTVTMPLWKAVGHRLRRTYLGLLLVLLVVWIARITVFEPTEQWRQTAAVPGLDGETVVIVVAGVYLLFILLAAWTARGTEIREFQA